MSRISTAGVIRMKGEEGKKVGVRLGEARGVAGLRGETSVDYRKESGSCSGETGSRRSGAK